MSNQKWITKAKLMVLLGFLFLIVSTYYLRSEVLALSHIKFSADAFRSANELEQLRESYPDRVKQYEAEVKDYEIKQKHYRKMLEIYQNHYDEYVKRNKEEYGTPRPPDAPEKPQTPEVAEKIFEINANFRARKHQYFEVSRILVWLACIAALMLVGGLVYLLLFDDQGQRWHYLAALVISFVFLIGPAFHSIMTGIIGFLREPGVY